MKRVNEYINSLLPKNIPEKKKNELAAEMKDHICEKIDFYMEIGYDKESSIQKSLNDFGEENEVRESIKSRFEELYHERWYYAVVFGAVPLILNLIAVFTSIGIFALSYGDAPSVTSVAVSSLLVTVVVAEILLAYVKGYRKSLIAVGISNILIGTTVIFIYPFSALHGFALDVCYILDRFTPLYMKDITAAYFSTFGQYVLLAFISIVSFLFSAKIKNKGKPKVSTRKKSAVFVLSLFILSFVNAGIYSLADPYFEKYAEWFHQHDTVTPETKIIYDYVEGHSDYEEIKAYLIENGYVNTEDYIKTLDKNVAKRFRYNLKEMEFSFDDSHEIFFNPDRDNSYGADEYYSNGFVFLQKDEKGKIIGKGVGLGAEMLDRYGGWRHYCSNENDVDKCLDDFLNMKKGEEKEKVLDKICGENGHFYSIFTTYSEEGTEDYYRIHCYGIPKKPFYKYEKDRSLYIEFYFENDKLTYGTLQYNDYVNGGIVTKKISS